MNNPAQFASYKNLIVYQKAKSLTVDIITHFSGKRTPYKLDFILNQLFRSASSVGANIAEGYGRHYMGSLKQFYSIARGSAFETDYWLEVLSELPGFDRIALSQFISRNTEQSKMLTSLMKSASKS